MDTQRAQLLDYRTSRTAPSRSRLWIVSLLLGIAQLPWTIWWMLSIAEWRSMQSVRLLHDSVLHLLVLLPTFTTIGIGAFCTHQARRSSNLRVLITCAIVVGVSILLTTLVAHDWYFEVYLNRRGIYGFW
jgi:hypothetical protein